MNISVIADQQVFINAIQDAEQVNKVAALQGLNAPMDSSIQGRLDEAWDEIKGLLKHCLEDGKEKTKALHEKVQQRVEELIKESGSHSRQVEALLKERIRQYQTSFVDGLFKQVKSEIKVGNTLMSINQIELNQKITLGGSLKASLTEAVALTSSGEMEISATYTIPTLPQQN